MITLKSATIAASQFYGIKPADFFRRGKGVQSKARQAAIYIASNTLGMTGRQIATAYGIHHTSVYSAVAAIGNRMTPELDGQLSLIEFAAEAISAHEHIDRVPFKSSRNTTQGDKTDG